MSRLTKYIPRWLRYVRLHHLEKVIAPPQQRPSCLTTDVTNLLRNGGPRNSERALEQFLNLCESDTGVRTVMEREHLSRVDLKGVILRLLERGFGEWIKGHYAALSTIAYAEPLEYFVRAEKVGMNRQLVYFNLLEYWEGRFTCPYCLSIDVRRSTLHGWQDFMRGFHGVFPWRCGECKERFYMPRRWQRIIDMHDHVMSGDYKVVELPVVLTTHSQTL